MTKAHSIAMRVSAAALALFIWNSSAPAATEPGRVVAAVPAAVPVDRSRDLSAVNSKLNSILTLRASFSQTDAQGSATGHFYLSRPGGLRFEYDPPRKLLVIANDRTVLIQENPEIAGYRVAINETPLRLLLKPGIDLARDANITDVRREDGQLFVTAVETKGYGQGQVTFVFSEPSLELRRWVVTDALGAQTMVSLADLEHDVALDKSLFKLPQIETGIGKIR